MLPSFLLFSASFLSIFRILFFPFFGSLSTVVSAFPISIYSICLLIFCHKPPFLTLIILLAISFSFQTFFQGSDLIYVIAAIIETIVPYILIFGITFVYHNSYVLDRFTLRRLTLIIFFGLAFGMLLQLFGVSLPVFKSVPVGADFTAISLSRFSSFVGTSGPFAISLAYIVISCMIIFPNFSLQYLSIGIILEFFSLSRSGLAILLVYFILLKAFSFKWYLSQFIVFEKKKFFLITLLLLPISVYILWRQYDTVLLIFDRFVMAFNFINDPGSAERISRSSSLLSSTFENPVTFLIGNGTGTTARIIGGEQGESQLLKIIYEWGLLGSLFLFYCTYRLIRKWSLDQRSLALLSTIFINLCFLQVFTSPPIYVSMAIAIWCLRDSSYLSKI